MKHVVWMIVISVFSLWAGSGWLFLALFVGYVMKLWRWPLGARHQWLIDNHQHPHNVGKRNHARIGVTNGDAVRLLVRPAYQLSQARLAERVATIIGADHRHRNRVLVANDTLVMVVTYSPILRFPDITMFRFTEHGDRRATYGADAWSLCGMYDFGANPRRLNHFRKLIHDQLSS